MASFTLAARASHAAMAKASPTVAKARAPVSLSAASRAFSRGSLAIPTAAASRARPLAVSRRVEATLSTVRVVIQGRNVEVTESIREYMDQKIDSAVGHFEAAVREVDAKLSVRGGDSGKGKKAQRCELTIYTKYGIVRAEEEQGDLYASIDLVCDKASRQLRKMKEKAVKKGLASNSGSRGSKVISEVVDDLPEVNFDLSKVPSVPKDIVRAKYYHMPAMDIDEALERMKLVDHAFYAFRSKQTGEINVLYERNHGGYGVIIPRSDEEEGYALPEEEEEGLW